MSDQYIHFKHIGYADHKSNVKFYFLTYASNICTMPVKMLHYSFRNANKGEYFQGLLHKLTKIKNKKNKKWRKIQDNQKA